MSSLPILDVQNLTISTIPKGPTVPAIKVLNDISFRLEKRQVLGIIGESGSGKTILSRALAAWLPAGLHVTGGRVRYKDIDLAHMTRAQALQLRGREIGYIGSNPSSVLDPTIPIGRQIIEKLRSVNPNIGTREAKEKVIDLIGAVRIPSPKERFNEYPFQFSGGMMQRVMIVDALISDPTFLIADNVTQPLDVTVAAQIIRLLRELVNRFDTAIVFTAASLPMAAEISDEVLVMQAGSIIERAEPQKLIESPTEPYTIDLVDKIPLIWSSDAHTPVKPQNDAGTDAPILSVQNVGKSYEVRDRTSFNKTNIVRAVRSVSFDVQQGDSFGIVGESGCGKSTLTRLLTLLEAPDRGTIKFNGQDLSASNPRQLRRLRQKFQLLLQDPYNSLAPGKTVGDLISEPLILHKLASQKEARQQAVHMMEEVGLSTELYGKLPTHLSAGQRQRINVARALILKPELIILDETLSSLDQVEQTRLLALFDRLQEQYHLTYIYISHDLAMVRRVCTRVAVMYLGEVVELAHNNTVFHNPGHPYSKALLSAIPTREDKPFLASECLLEGEPPSPIELPPGCGFANRCPKAFDRCHVESPVLIDRGNQDFAACFLLEETVAVPA